MGAGAAVRRAGELAAGQAMTKSWWEVVLGLALWKPFQDGVQESW